MFSDHPPDTATYPDEASRELPALLDNNPADIIRAATVVISRVNLHPSEYREGVGRERKILLYMCTFDVVAVGLNFVTLKRS